MSVDQLVLGDSPIKLKISSKSDKIYITLADEKTIGGIVLNRNQADLLKLYLQEHLK